MIRFSKSNFERFKTHNKLTTIRGHELKAGEHDFIGGSRMKPFAYGHGFVHPAVKKCRIRDLTEADAKNDGFDSLCELLLELGHLGKGEFKPETWVWVHGVTLKR